VHETPPDQPSTIQEMIDRTSRKLARKHKVKSGAVDWIEWPGSGTFTKRSKPGDLIIQIWCRAPKARPSRVYKAVPILDRQRVAGKLYVFVGQPAGRNASLPWGRFRQLLKRVGGPTRISANTERTLRPEIAVRLQEHWSTVH
jgi:hypothetical protein